MVKDRTAIGIRKAATATHSNNTSNDDNDGDGDVNDNEEEEDESSLLSESELPSAESSDAADYERKPRRAPEARLPVRDKFGRMVAPPARDASDDDDDDDNAAEGGGGGDNGGDDDDDAEEAQSGGDPLLGENGEKLGRDERLALARTRIAAACDEVVQQPDERIELLRDVMTLARDYDSAVVRLALLSLLAVFRHILPSYRIRDDYSSEGDVRLSKSVLAVRRHEKAMLDAYRQYVELLSRAVARRRTPPPTRLACARCLGSLLAARSDFNLSDTVIAALVALAGGRDEAAAREACLQMSNLFKADPDGALSLVLVRAIARLIKAHARIVRPQVCTYLFVL
jgi:hypothetical protein